MAKRLRVWQERGLIILNNLVGINPEFEAEIEYLRAHRNEPADKTHSINALLKAYDIPSGAWFCIEHYINTGELKAELIHSSILIVSDKNRTAEPYYMDKRSNYEVYNNGDHDKVIKIVIPADVTQGELIDFVKRYRLDIERNLDEISDKPRKRTRSKPKEKRNQDILRWSDEGYTTADIARKVEQEYPEDDLAITTQDIRNILSRIRSK